VHYFDGNQVCAFIKSTHYAIPDATKSHYNNNLVGVVSGSLPLQCVYLDWFNFDATPVYWRQRIEKYLSDVHFDGLWTTGNEPYSSEQGEVNANGRTLQSVHEEKREDYFDTKWYSSFDQAVDSTYMLPFTPGFAEHGPFDNFSVSLNGSHAKYSWFNPVTQKVEV
jgi:alpha-glucosidase (family GH31 glycosyl hydrolase)